MTKLSIGSIPHRAPFLFVDEIVEVDKQHIVTTRFVDPAADFFRGHYPGRPIMPGVLVCECCFQAGALLVAHIKGDLQSRQGVPVVTRIKDARFKRMVGPGDTIRCDVALDDVLDDCYFLTGRASVEGKAAARVEFACLLADVEEGAA